MRLATRGSGIDSPIFTFACCKVKKFWTENLVWNLGGLESEIFNEKRWDVESYTRFQLGVGPLARGNT